MSHQNCSHKGIEPLVDNNYGVDNYGVDHDAVNDASFSRVRRLLTAADYRAVFSAPEIKSGQNELLLLARRNNLPTHRLGLAIAKKHIPTAVGRNALKRRIREYFRREIAATATYQGNHRSSDSCVGKLDIIALTRAAAGKAPPDELTKAIDRQFRRLIQRART